ncbi:MULTISPECIES: hypothetical protein [unclassified Nodularia (in: cyanobacteria)]|uniref:hypothetical protein n=1 Tax=unclassified Nodularia (in: cyanobacteria) TaxID=2656917 RepID=UPI0018806812|nr:MULTISPECIES: hypothetical protein [unclassified Nodularia (in: cyanobacteria)]MBE9201714.1 hypothetical protein [Nodularia sp. LEGE 06071]MCC2691257.1 hypothetical protein [Nodularia sp. LEGE 04288]
MVFHLCVVSGTEAAIHHSHTSWISINWDAVRISVGYFGTEGLSFTDRKAQNPDLFMNSPAFKIFLAIASPSRFCKY